MNEFDFGNVKFDKDFIKFIISTNLCSTLDLPVTYLVPIITNKYLGLAEISVYKILEKIRGIVTVAVNVINQVMSLEISKKIAKNDIKGALNVATQICNIILTIGIMILCLLGLTYKLWMGIFIESYEYYMPVIHLYFSYIIYTFAFSGQNPVFVFAGFVK